MRICITVLLFLISLAAQADVFRCNRDTGQYLSSEPCPSGAVIIKTEKPRQDVIEVKRIGVRRGAGGVFNIKGAINNRPVAFILDSGAGSSVISGRVAELLGISDCPLVETSITANGTGHNCKIIVSSLRVAGAQFSDVVLRVSPNMEVDALLGNDLLSAFKIEMRQGLMILEH